MSVDEPQEITLSVKGAKEVTAKDLTVPGQVEILNADQHIATLTAKDAKLEIRMTIEKGLGYVPKEVLQKDKMDIGMIALDASFTPIKRVNYEVENMRVGDRTDYNRLKISIETDGTLTPREALERSIETMIVQLKAIVGFKEEEPMAEEISVPAHESAHLDADTLKTRVEDLDISTRTINALTGANIRTAGGLARKTEADLLELDGIGDKGVDEIKSALKKLGISLKS
jgi:DNA-directed RNA polymerase subunit alpha